MPEQPTATCPECSRTISPDDTVVFRRRLVGHLDCRRPRVLSAEERTLLIIYCRDHEVAECVRCGRKSRLPEAASRDSFGVRLHACPACHTDLTDYIRTHLYSCAVLPAEVRRRALAAREAARGLVKQSHQLSDAADLLLREAEAALYALRDTMRQAPTRIAIGYSGRDIRLLAYHVLPMHLEVGDRFPDETGEWEVASRPYSTAGGEKVNAGVRRVAHPAIVEERTWVALERIRVHRAQRDSRSA